MAIFVAAKMMKFGDLFSHSRTLFPLKLLRFYRLSCAPCLIHVHPLHSLPPCKYSSPVNGYFLGVQATNRLSFQYSPFLFGQKRQTTSEPGYTNFGHAKVKQTPYQIILWSMVGFIVCMLVYETYFDKDWTEEVQTDFRFKAASKRSVKSSDPKNEDKLDESSLQEESNKVEQKGKKSKTTFRERKIIAYEDRIRAFSTPEKIFRYFATLKVYAPGEPQHGPSFEVFMTPEDFVRSITPGTKQPDGLGLEQFATFDPDHDHLRSTLDSGSVFLKLGKHGLISYTDYVFLLTVLSTSARHFALAFKMFDINGDGELDYNEFDMVETVIRNQTSVGARHRDHSTTGTVLRRHTNSALAAYFFGQNLDQKLTIERFLLFQEHLQRDILKLEFQRREPKDGKITELAFCRMLLQHSGLNEKSQQRMLKRVKKMYKEEDGATGITLKDVESFFRFMNNINDVDTALTFYHMAGASVDPRTLQHVSKSVAGVEISDYVIEVVFALFDENQDGELSNREFINVMKRRLMRGLERPKDTGFTRVLSAIMTCAYERLSFH